MSEVEEMMQSIEVISKELQLKLLKGEMKWEDEAIQFFIPVILNFTEFDWLELIAENNLIEEDAIIVKNFLGMAKSLAKINADQLHDAISKEIGGLFK